MATTLFACARVSVWNLIGWRGNTSFAVKQLHFQFIVHINSLRWYRHVKKISLHFDAWSLYLRLFRSPNSTHTHTQYLLSRSCSCIMNHCCKLSVQVRSSAAALPFTFLWYPFGFIFCSKKRKIEKINKKGIHYLQLVWHASKGCNQSERWWCVALDNMLCVCEWMHVHESVSVSESEG